MNPLDLHEIQGIIVYGYGKFAAACYLLLQVTQPDAAKAWLATLADDITTAAANPSYTEATTCQNLAFTARGLQAIGLDPQIGSQFSGEFCQGMEATQHRQRILGDHGDSAPEYWQWGGPKTPPVHLLLQLYARDEATLEQLYAHHVSEFEQHGVHLIKRLDTYRLPNRREHFGFRDDIADPAIAGTDRQDSPANTIKAGEFILGYPNAYGQYTYRPLVPSSQDPEDLLPLDTTGSGQHDLGRNGSYLVFRQLHQDVKAFWETLETQTRTDEHTSNPDQRLYLAAKMVGRWPSGAPLVTSPDQDDPAQATANQFAYHTEDPHGYRCPFGAHIRRVNPRDSLDPNPGSQESLERVNRHRILRRGRAYGPPLHPSMDPEAMLKAEGGEVERGLHFLCFNANISRQFEFIQHTWVNNTKFDDLYSDDDPLIGDRGRPPLDGTSGTFTLQREPVRQRCTGLPRFVQVRGGAYFFTPSISAIRFLASLPTRPAGGEA